MTKTILLVEDNDSDEKLTLRAFKKADVGAEFVVVRDGAEALELLFGTGKYQGEIAKLPAFILLDLNLPRLGGFEVLRRLRADARTNLIPIIVLTASKEDEDILRSYSLGANAYVRKLLDFNEFAAAIKALGVFWLQVNELPAR